MGRDELLPATMGTSAICAKETAGGDVDPVSNCPRFDINAPATALAILRNPSVSVRRLQGRM
jgi:hypothetical protein